MDPTPRISKVKLSGNLYFFLYPYLLIMLQNPIVIKKENLDENYKDLVLRIVGFKPFILKVLKFYSIFQIQ